jgi:hypothetical protein
VLDRPDRSPRAGQTQAALCVEPEINAMSTVGFVTATESVFEVIQQDLNRCSLRSRRRTAWWEFSARLFCALCQGALFSPVKERAGKLFAPAGSTRCFGELNPQAAFLSNWHIEVIAAKLASVAQGKFQRLIINLPPRHLKSLIASIACPACLGHDPSAYGFCCAATRGQANTASDSGLSRQALPHTDWVWARRRSL